MSLDEMAAKAFRVSSFTTVGHLLHINLKDNLLQHKHEIGKALLDNNPRALAVVNKLNTIDNTYRNFDIEIIAKREGCEKSDEDLMIVEVNENKCRFQFDFSKVYWNSRLCTEHERIIKKLLKPTDIMFDLFAGVGPFAVPAAKAKCLTYANDLNPESVKWLSVNMKRNKVTLSKYEIYNLNARDFILGEMKSRLFDIYKMVDDEDLAIKPTIHIVMNLPALAPTFLKHFVGLFKPEVDAQYTINSKSLNDLFRRQEINHVVYCYCFLKGIFDDPKAQVKSIMEEHMGRDLTQEQLVDISRVRNVAPYKDMYRADIKLDESILFNRKNITSIMRNNSCKIMNNGSAKKVTIHAPNGKRKLEESLDTSTESETESDQKKARFGDYCSIM